MPWPLIMLLQNIFAAVFALLSRSIITKYKHAHFQVLAIIFGCLYIVGLAYVFALGETANWGSFAQYWARYVSGGIFFGVWTYYSYLVFKYVDAAIASLLSLLNIVSVVVTATLLINESLTVQQLFGAIILLLAMALVFTAHTTKHIHNRWIIASMLTLVASSTYGLAISNEKWLIDNVGISTYIIFGWGFQFLPLFLLSLKVNIGAYRLLRKKDFINKILQAGFIRGAAGLTFIISLVAADNASLITVLSGFKVILAAIFGALLLRETNLLSRKLAAAIFATVGVAIMLWE